MATIALRLLIGYPIIKDWRKHQLETNDSIENVERRVEAMIEAFYADDPNVRIESNMPLGVIGLRVLTAADDARDSTAINDLWQRLLSAADDVQSVA